MNVVLRGFFAVLVLSLTPLVSAIPFVTGEFAPYSGKDLPANGLCSEIVRAAAAEAGLTAELEFYPWLRCETMVQAGNAWAAFPYAVTPERSKQFDFSQPLVDTRSRIYYASDHPKLKSWSKLTDFQGTKFAVVRGYWYMETLAQYSVKLVECDSLVVALRAVAEGRADYVIENELVMATTLKASMPELVDRFHSFTRPYQAMALHLMVSRGYPGSADLLRRFNAGLDRVRANGTYEALLARYGVK